MPDRPVLVAEGPASDEASRLTLVQSAGDPADPVSQVLARHEPRTPAVCTRFWRVGWVQGRSEGEVFWFWFFQTFFTEMLQRNRRRRSVCSMAMT